MIRSLLLAFVLGLAAVTPLTGASAVRSIGPVDIGTGSEKIPVRVSSGDAELQQLAQIAFGVHGRYRLVAEAFKYDIAFAPAGPSRVRVTVTRTQGSAPVLSQEVDGTGPNPTQARRNALLRAADLAVERTNEAGLRGFFAGTRLALIGERTGRTEVYTTADLFFGGVTQLTQDRSHALFPRWSPDGTRLVYTSYFRRGFPDIFTLNLATLQRTEVTNIQGTNMGGRFSPNGQRLVMTLSGTGTSRVYLANADGRSLRERTSDRNLDASSPAFSPDGSRIVFAGSVQGGAPGLYVMPVEGTSAPQRIATGLGNYNTEPDWSRANPNRIAFTIRVGGRFQVAVYDFSTGQARQVSEVGAPFEALEPVWLPDGRHLVVTLQSSRESQLHVLDTETREMKRLSPSSFGSAKQASVWWPQQ